MDLTGERPDDVTGLYERHVTMLYRYAVRRLGAAAAEDVVAETFLAAVSGWSGFDPGRGEARLWLFGILSHQISRHRRQEAAHLRACTALPLDPGPTDEADRVAERVSAAATGPSLIEALARLKPGDRDALLLLAWADLSYHEIAQALHIPVGTVRSRLNRARRIVRGVLPTVEIDLTKERTR